MMQRKKLLVNFVLVLVLVGSVGLAGSAAHPSAAQGTTSPELVMGNNAFAFDLYHSVSDQGENLILSPYSISLALAMTYAGARGDTERQMAETLHFPLPQDQIPAAFKALHETMPQDEGESGGEDEFRLNIANALWGQDGFNFLPEYLDVVNQNFGVGLQRVDFITDPEAARLLINDWVSEQTQERILDLIKPGVLNSDSRLVLTNAIYFKAAWQAQFMPEATHDAPFTLLDGSQITVPMMNQSAHYGYATGDGYQAVVLPYTGGRMAMMILLPDLDSFEAFESAELTAEQFSTTLNNLMWQEVVLSLPRFEYTADFGLADALQSLGMQDAFDLNVADFSGMSGQRDLFIQDVLHKAFVKLDETGTEAAAATAVIMGVTSAQMDPPVEVKVDHPFIYMIYDQQSGSI
ncbi:MAG: serpin family protein, partial [Chloroflexi bacterium]|nr:serpin family protein [Chloroflexota bacterium]